VNDATPSVLRPEVTGIVLSSLQNLLAERGTSVNQSIDEHTALIGHQAVLDSLGLVALVTEVEQRLEEECGAVVSLADDRAMSQKRSPFRTVGSLIEYIHQLLGEAT
jgi:acyl carrier protein